MTRINYKQLDQVKELLKNNNFVNAQNMDHWLFSKLDGVTLSIFHKDNFLFELGDFAYTLSGDGEVINKVSRY